MMKSKLFLFIFSFFTISLYASSNTCYSVQFASGYHPLNINNFPHGSKLIKIGGVYTIRYGCFENLNNANKELSRLQERYHDAIIKSTFKWRFHNTLENQTSKPTTEDSQLIDPRAASRLLSSTKQNTLEKNSSSLEDFHTQANTQKCYTVQLTLAQEELVLKEFPIGTKIIKRGDFFSACYGCYTKIDDAKMTLNRMKEKRFKAIIILLPKSYFNQNDPLPEIKKRGESLHHKNNYTSQESKEQKRSFYKRDNITLKTTEQKRCSSSIEKNIISCSQQQNSEFTWRSVDKYAVEEYIDGMLNRESNVQAIEPFETTTATNNELNETTISSSLRRQWNYYLSASLNIKNGQLDNQGELLTTRSLNLSAGFTYLYDFNPSWYFYTDNRLLYSIKKNSADLKFDGKELYIQSQNIFYNSANFLIGRKYLKDNRGWYYKTSLDTLGISNKNDLLLYELYFGKRLTTNTASYDPNEVETNLKDARFLFAHISYEYFKKNTIEGFFIYENNKNAAKKLNWKGVRLQGNLLQKNFNMLSYWGDIATMKGDLNQSSIKGLGFDIGAKYYFRNYFAAIAGSLAYGSGGSDLFVQPSFTNNRSTYLSPDLSFRYYGEFLQPELSNLTIGSLYFLHHFNTIKDQTLILAIHNYTQDKHSSIQYNATNKTVNPGGKKRNVGNEIDLILHYDLIEGTYWRFSGGYFRGGDAFDAKTDKRNGFSAEIYFKYLW